MRIKKFSLGMGLFVFGFSIVFASRTDYPFFLIFLPFIAFGAYILTQSVDNNSL
jgi:hypothetical protein